MYWNLLHLFSFILIIYINYSKSTEDNWEMYSVNSGVETLNKEQIKMQSFVAEADPGSNRRNAAVDVLGNVASSPFVKITSGNLETQIRTPFFRNNEIYSMSEFPDYISVQPNSLPATSLMSGLKCSKPGYLQNPENCQKFYNCVKVRNNYQLFSLNCVDGTIFFSPLSKCVNPKTISPRLRPQHCKVEGKSTDDVPSNFATTSTPIQMFLLDKDVEVLNTDEGQHKQTVESELEQTVNSISGFPSNIQNIPHASVNEEVETFMQNLTPGDPTVFGHASSIEYDYSDDPLQFLDNIETQNSDDGELNELNFRALDQEGRTFPKRSTKPRLWFGIRNHNNNGVRTVGNPFKADETTIAVILDFTTSRLEIYSRNRPPK